MGEIYLRNKGLVALVDEDTYETLGHLVWTASRTGATWYAVRCEKHNGASRRLFLHRAVMDAPAGLQVDHINGNGLDCRRENLRLVTASQNRCNRPAPSHNKSGYKGVFFNTRKQRWQAAIRLHGRQTHLGFFATPEAAYAAYCEAAPKAHGEHARIDGAGWRP